MNDIRCITSPAPFQCGRSNAITSTPGNAVAQRRDRGRVRAVAVPDEQRLVVEPDRVAALDGGGRGRSRPTTGTPAASSARDDRLGLAASSLLAGREQHRAVVADEDRVVDVDRVGVAGVVLGDDDLGARGLEQCEQNASCSAAAAATSGRPRQP